MKIYQAFCFLFLLITVFSCSTEENNPLEIDVSSVDIDVVLYRLEHQLDEVDTSMVQEKNQQLIGDLGYFYEQYTKQALRMGSPYDPAIVYRLKEFLSFKDYQDLNDDLIKEFKDFKEYSSKIENGLKHIKYYYKDAITPKLVTCNSFFSNGIMPTDSVLGIGLEMYLGPDNEFVKSLPKKQFPDYFKKRMNADFLVADAVQGWYKANFEVEQKGQDFLARILYEGKLMYALDAFLPKEKAEIKMRYSAKQLKWCETNEVNIWKEIVKQDLLHTHDALSIDKFVSPAPFTSGLPKDSSPRVGVWLGWQIVKDYMKKNPKVTLVDLMKETNNQKILSAYDPNN